MSEQLSTRDLYRLKSGEKHVWKRRRLPLDNHTNGMVWGMILIILGFVCIIASIGFEPSRYGPALAQVFLGIIGTPLLICGLFLSSVTMIVQEIRQLAFEAALRSGEVRSLEIPEAKSPEA